MARLGIAYGFVVQFVNVGLWGGDAFNPVGLALNTGMGSKRWTKLIVMLMGAPLLAYALKEVQGKDWVEKNIIPALGAPKVCGYGDTANSCKMSLCGFYDAIQGTCDTGKSKGCCIDPVHLVYDEARHFFLLSYLMRVFNPIMGFTVPFWAAFIQASIRLLPSAMTGVVCNPNPAFLRSILTGDWSILHLVVLGTFGGQLAALLAGTATSQLISLVRGGSSDKAVQGKSRSQGSGKKSSGAGASQTKPKKSKKAD
ncbi:hypothetical protein GUITHDRAFT_120903 [Guillardia theta CCMP2712]|uniref:Uncharacterized protein n=1 Tax=Guillardia theta (strain CCMP2712) TaxID=905079 RepID=L1I9L7_GUITC|nr:hypothetical protein GUITHDRAFT_120903 [Guillardia theta CCMP2712]EKX32918.1 hypothetical protein GUITHDRAFT_120903 [Guillardia theta CCMP2712]|eukprot:XP_005819898.1 hypothetical protein GUITHDRAFT_120903 [Guillardia theta CCMP2712]